jgi:formate dehydrogenase major subunit
MLQAERTVATIGCQIDRHVRQELAYRASGRFDSPVNHGRLCDHGRPGTDFVHALDRLRQPMMRSSRQSLGLFAPVEYRPAAEATDEEYPFLLSTGRILFHGHGGTFGRRSADLDWLTPEAEVEIQPDDAAALGVEEREVVEVRWRRGGVRARAKLTQCSPPATIFLTFHYAEAAAN